MNIDQMQLAYLRNPRWCACMSRPDAPSTHRGAAHFSSCRHSTLRETTAPPRPRPRLKPIPGTRNFTVSLD